MTAGLYSEHVNDNHFDSFGGLVVACCAEDGRFRVRSRAGSEQDFKLYSLLSGVSTAHKRGWRGVASCKEIKMGTYFLGEGHLGLGWDIMLEGVNDRKLFPRWGSLISLGSKNGLVGGVGPSCVASCVYPGVTG